MMNRERLEQIMEQELLIIKSFNGKENIHFYARQYSEEHKEFKPPTYDECLAITNFHLAPLFKFGILDGMTLEQMLQDIVYNGLQVFDTIIKEEK